MSISTSQISWVHCCSTECVTQSKIFRATLKYECRHTVWSKQDNNHSLSSYSLLSWPGNTSPACACIDIWRGPSKASSSCRDTPETGTGGSLRPEPSQLYQPFSCQPTPVCHTTTKEKAAVEWQENWGLYYYPITTIMVKTSGDKIECKTHAYLPKISFPLYLFIVGVKLWFIRFLFQVKTTLITGRLGRINNVRIFTVNFIAQQFWSLLFFYEQHVPCVL